MADPGNALLFLLNAATPVTDLVSDRIYRVNLPKDPTYPAIVFTLVTEITSPDHDAGVTKEIDPIWQIDCYGADTDVVSALRDAVFNATDQKKGIFAGVNVIGLFYTGQRDMHDEEPEVYRRVIEEKMYVSN